MLLCSSFFSTFVKAAIHHVINTYTQLYLGIIFIHFTTTFESMVLKCLYPEYILNVNKSQGCHVIHFMYIFFYIYKLKTLLRHNWFRGLTSHVSCSHVKLHSTVVQTFTVTTGQILLQAKCNQKQASAFRNVFSRTFTGQVSNIEVL